MAKPKKRKNKSIEPPVLGAFLKFVQKNKRIPSRAEMLEAGFKRDVIRYHFGSLTAMADFARENHPKYFVDVVDSSLFTDKNFQGMQEEVAKHKRFVITTAVAGCEVHEKFYKSLKSYCAKNNAALLIIPVEDPAHRHGGDKLTLSHKLSGEHIVFQDMELNSNLAIRTIKLSAKQIDPVTGLSRLGQRDGSFIYGSPKQRLHYVPVGEQKLPHALMSTGAITLPDYATEKYFSMRTAYLAEYDHIVGAVIVEIEDDVLYHFRQIQAEPKTGAFVDLGDYYKSNGDVGRLPADTFVLGDYHAGEHDLSAKQAWKEVVEAAGVKNLVVHDFFNGASINHHDSHKSITKARKMEGPIVSLWDELAVTALELIDVLKWVPGQVIWTKDNHGEFLNRYLEEARYANDPLNLKIASQLVAPMIDGQDPLRFALEELMGVREKRLRWLKRDERFRIFGIECGAHGDKGPNGAKATPQNLERAYGSCVVGHAHSPAILRGVYRVGTSSLLKLDYNVGPSSWLHSSCLVYPNGSRQMINSIGGKWRLK